MNDLYIIDQVVSAIQEQWRGVREIVSHSPGLRSTPTNNCIEVMGVNFSCLVENEINGSNLHRIEERVSDHKKTTKEPILLIANYVQPSVYEILRKKGLNFADTAGNYDIRYQEGEKMILSLSHTGEKAPASTPRSYPIFQEAGLKVIFYLLQDPENVAKPFRQIKEHSGVSLGTVKNIIDELEARSFVLSSKRKRVLRQRRRLLDLWSENYQLVLKPKLLLKQMDFRSEEHKERWREIALPEGMMWGGECASNILNGFLTPETFEIYTEVPFSHLMKTGATTTSEGSIYVYQKFWKGNSMPLILTYADLVTKGDSRCMEAANKLLDDELSDFK